MSEIATIPDVPADPRIASDRCALSVVIPAYNEESRISPTVMKVGEYLRAEGEPFEIIVVDDGSRDATLAVARKLQEKLPELRVLGYPRNRGKGYAVRTGALQARGDAVLISDADLSTPIEELASLRRAIEAGAHVAIASRHLAGSLIEVSQPLSRRYLGRVFNFVIAVLGVRGFADTQCGFKLFQASAARSIFSRIKTPGFAFDVEALLLARGFGCRVKEIPVRWANSSASRVRPVRDSVNMIVEILRMRGMG